MYIRHFQGLPQKADVEDEEDAVGESAGRSMTDRRYDYLAALEQLFLLTLLQCGSIQGSEGVVARRFHVLVTESLFRSSTMF